MIAKITFTKPEGADLNDIAAFINDALTSWGGGLHPDDPMFHSLKLTRLEVHGQEFTVKAKKNAPR